MTTGRFRFPLRNLSAGRYWDFHAVNYYTRSTVSGLADGVRENAPVNDPGWDIYPPGIAECAKKDVPAATAADLHHENGTCDRDDRCRCRYLFDHV